MGDTLNPAEPPEDLRGRGQELNVDEREMKEREEAAQGCKDLLAELEKLKREYPDSPFFNPPDEGVVTPDTLAKLTLAWEARDDVMHPGR